MTLTATPVVTVNVKGCYWRVPIPFSVVYPEEVPIWTSTVLAFFFASTEDSSFHGQEFFPPPCRVVLQWEQGPYPDELPAPVAPALDAVRSFVRELS